MKNSDFEIAKHPNKPSVNDVNQLYVGNEAVFKQ